MADARPSTTPGHSRGAAVAGGAASVAIACVVYSRFNLYSALQRDSAIYLYAGQRVTHGVPPYASIMDPKGPLPGILCGLGVAVARLLGGDDLLATRIEFCVLSILAVLGVFLLTLELWHSSVAAVVAAAVFTSFRMFAYDALAGPDGHTPGIVFLIFALWLTVRRNWYLAGLLASAAFFSWQPLFPYPVVVGLCALAWSGDGRWRALGRVVAGAATPLVALAAYYAAEGHLGDFVVGTFWFPLRGIYRPARSVDARLRWFAHDLPHWYGPVGAALLWAGWLLLLAGAIGTIVAGRPTRRAALSTPVVLLLGLSLLTQVLYVAHDYIGWTHTFPLLPYSALGFGMATAYVLQHVPRGQWTRAVAVTAAAAVVLLTGYSAVHDEQRSSDAHLLAERAGACAVQRAVVPGTTLWSVDDPILLVLLHRPNPDNYPYVGSGLAMWRVEHTAGGFRGWMRQIRRSASVVTLQFWRERTAIHRRTKRWLRTHGYRPGWIGPFSVSVTRAAQRRMAALGVALTSGPRPWPVTTSGRVLRTTTCTPTQAG